LQQSAMVDNQFRGLNMVIPIAIDMKTWWSSLAIDFPNDNIPVLNDKRDWKVTGNFLVQENSFAIQGAPSTFAFNDFEPWAMEVFLTMNNF